MPMYEADVRATYRELFSSAYDYVVEKTASVSEQKETTDERSSNHR
jgi:hypothetical protein